MRENIRIFVSSPGDVVAPREIAAQAIERLAQDFARFFTIEPPYLWQNEPLNASRHFQDDIDAPSNFDIVILILQQRLGTVLPAKTAVREYRGIDGRVPVTGTEWEYEDALRSARESGAPDLPVYRSRNQASVDSWDPDKRAEQLKQLDALDKFWARHFANKGVFLGAYTEFSSLEEFATRLEGHLRQLLKKRMDKSGISDRKSVEQLWLDAPFRGLESYEFEHAKIFFGRDDAVRQSMLQLTAHAAAGLPFLLVLGASGSGKSSLVKAGVVPKLFVPRRVSGSAFLRRVEFRPSDAQYGEDLFDALARAFATKGRPNVGLPELVSASQPIAMLAQHLRSNRTIPAFPVTMVLDQLAKTAKASGGMLEYEVAKLVLVIDQLEELFTGERFTPEERQHFVEVIQGFVNSGRVWVVAAMRKDFWHRADDVPELVRLSEGAGRIDLLPPSPAQLGQIIKHPADAAGLEFEIFREADGGRRSGLALNEVIAEEVARESGALPLLSYLLDQLYRKDIVEGGGSVLSFATYERLGELKGAIATKAEEVIAKLGAEERATLTSVLFSLVQIDVANGDVERAVARRVRLSEYPAGSPRRRLIDAFLDADARLLVSDAGTAGTATVRVAHEALLTHWPQAKTLIVEARSDLQLRGRLEQDAAQWQAAKPEHRESFLLRAGLPLSQAEDLLARRREDLEQSLLAYIEASTDLATQEQRRRLRQSRQIAGGAVASAAVFLVLAIFSAVSWQKSERSLDAATGAISGLVDTFEILQPVAKLDEIQSLVDRAREAIDRLSGIGSDYRLVEERARALMILASIDFDRGHIGQMKTDASAALSLLSSISDRSDVSVRYEVANTRRLLGLANYQLYRKSDSRSEFEGTISELKALIRGEPNDPNAWKWSKTLADTDQLLGDVLLDEFNDPVAAARAYEACYRIRQQLARAGHRGANMDHDLAWAANKLGDVEGRIGHDDLALTWFQTARLGMAALGNHLVLWPYDLALINNNIGLVLMRKADYVHSVDSFQQAVAEVAAAIDNDPKNNIRRSVLGWTYDNMGDALFHWAKMDKDRSRLELARRTLQNALAIREEVAREAPEKPLFHAGVQNARGNIANVEATLFDWNGDLPRAAKRYNDAASLYSDTYAFHMKQYGRPDRLLLIVEMLRSSAADYQKARDLESARAQLRRALVLLQQNSRQLDEHTFEAIVQAVTRDRDTIHR